MEGDRLPICDGCELHKCWGSVDYSNCHNQWPYDCEHKGCNGCVWSDCDYEVMCHRAYEAGIQSVKAKQNAEVDAARRETEKLEKGGD